LAYGNLISYEPAPTPGAYHFTTRDGRKLFAFGAQAEVMKRRLDQANAVGPQKTAQLGPMANMSSALSGGPPAAPPPTRADVKRWPAAPATAAAAPAAPGASASAPVAPATAPTAPAQSSEPEALGLGFYKDPKTGMILQYDPGSPGSKGGPVERSRTERGGFDPDPAYKAAKWELLQAQTDNIDEQRRQHAENFEADQTLLQDQRVMAIDAIQEEHARKRAIDQGVEEATAKHDAVVQEYTSAKEDPSRALSGGKNWIYGLAIGLGTFGAAMNKRQSQAVDIVQKQIDRDIAAQRTEIAIKRDAADNALADLTRKLGSQERAENALKQIQNQLIQNSLAQQASREKNAEKLASLKALQLGLQERFLDLNEQDRRLAQGEVTKHIVNAPAEPPRQPGLRPVKDQTGTARALADLRNAEGKAQGDGKTPAAVPTERTNKVALNSQIIEQADGIVSQLPPEEDEWGDPASGPVDSTWNKGESNKLNEATSALATSVQIGSGAGSTADDRKQAGELVGEGGSVSARRRGAQRAASEAAQRIAIEIATLPPEQQEQAIKAMPRATQKAVLDALKKGGQ